MMKLSVIIPCYNAASTIGEQLEALSNQQWDHPWEVVIANNGSTDESLEIVNGYKNKINNLKLVDASQKKGIAFARNTAVKQCSGEYVAFCDADDVVGNDWVASIGNALQKHNFVACRMEWAELNNMSESRLRLKKQTSELMDFTIVKFLPHAGGGSLGIKKSIHLDVNGFDETLPVCEDTDYCFRVQLKGIKLTFVPEAVIHIRERIDKFGSFKQRMNWAEFNIFLYMKYRQYGLPEYSIKPTLKSIYYMFRSWKYFFSEKKRDGSIRRLGDLLGRLKGVVKYRVFKH